jgi:hypothetical protein
MPLIAVPISEAIPADLVELWLERCAIMEFDGHLTRQESEWQAFLLCIGGERSNETGPDLAA